MLSLGLFQYAITHVEHVNSKVDTYCSSMCIPSVPFQSLPDPYNSSRPASNVASRSTNIKNQQQQQQKHFPEYPNTEHCGRASEALTTPSFLSPLTAKEGRGAAEVVACLRAICQGGA